jgi:ABC-2 type transport system ATP-binding protein
MSAPVIEAKGLTKRYGRAVAVKGVDLAVNEGEVFGLLGPNGSGKTTTILMMLGLTEPTGGRVTIAGLDPLREPLEVKRHVGYLPDSVGFYDQMTARENLAYSARLMGLPSKEATKRIDRALVRVGLDHVANKRTNTFSHGMRQRLGVAELLVKQAQVMILDEPTNGLDPQATQDLLKLIADLRRDGMTIVLSSHLLGLVQSICDRVALFRNGRVGLVGRVDDLARKVLGGAFTVEVEAEGLDLATALDGLAGIVAVTSVSPTHVRVDTQADIRPAIARRILDKGGQLREMALKRASLDDVYVRYFETKEEVANAA